MSHRLRSVAAVSLVAVRFSDHMKVGAQANLATAYLCGDRADGAVGAHVCCERPPRCELKYTARAIQLLQRHLGHFRGRW